MTLWFVRIWRTFRHHKRASLGVILGLVVFSLVGNALCFMVFEKPKQPYLIQHFGDALWYSVISVTTIGYGDFYPITLGGRLGTIVFVIFLGLGTFSLLITMMVDWVSDWATRGQYGMLSIHAKDHILIVNFPSTARVRQILRELRNDASSREKEVVIVTDQIDRLPFAEENVLFVHGSPLEEETYHRAKILDAKLAIVLATSYTDPTTSDAVVASAVAVMDRLLTELHIVAECLNFEHRLLFESVRCDAVVYSLQISSNLLVQEIQDPGVSQLLEVITTNLRGATLFSASVLEDITETNYKEIAKGLLDENINLICVNRGADSLTSFDSIQPTTGDIVIYAATQRRSWAELKQAAALG